MVNEEDIKKFYRLFAFLGIVLFTYPSMAQIHLGPKVGFQAYKPIYKEAVMYDDISSNPMLGYNLGLAFDYNANKVFSFYSEIFYSQKGKKLSGGINNEFKHKAKYHFIALPILARLTFHENIKGKVFKWYLNGGGMVNYWLAGSGKINSFEFDETNVETLDYKIKYHAKPENTRDEEFKIYMAEPNRLQVGLVFGGGLLLQVNPANILMLDLRYTYTHSWLGRDKEVDVGLYEYFEDFRTMEHCLSFSAAYLFEFTIGEGKKGKSSNGAKIKTKTVGKPPEKKKKDINKITKKKK